jgi:hypothetical protein
MHRCSAARSLCGKAAGGCTVEAGRNKRLANPLIYVFMNLYREETRAALTDVKISANEITPYSMEEIEEARSCHTARHEGRMEIRRDPLMGRLSGLFPTSHGRQTAEKASFWADCVTGCAYGNESKDGAGRAPS